MVAPIGGAFDHCQQIRERLCAGPELATDADASPAPAYQQKVDHLLAVLAEVAAPPRSKIALFVDAMGFFRWPLASRDWCEKAPAPIP